MGEGAGAGADEVERSLYRKYFTEGLLGKASLAVLPVQSRIDVASLFSTVKRLIRSATANSDGLCSAAFAGYRLSKKLRLFREYFVRSYNRRQEKPTCSLADLPTFAHAASPAAMADTVRQLMEAMVPELQALEATGYFSRTEVRQIIVRRQDHEYALKRRAAVKADYLRAVEYEMQLEELRRHRHAAARARAEARTTLCNATTLAGHCIVRRVHFIYDRATRKFHGDVALWASWLQFCHASGSARQMSRVLSRALRLHPTVSALWTYAAAWEFEHNLDTGAARALMQRGLRLCSGGAAAELLWHEYFRLELLYAARLRKRRRVLGVDGMGADELVAGGLVSSGDPSTVAVQAVLNGAVAQVVFKNAIAAVPGSLSFRAKFLDMLQLFEDFPGKTHLEVRDQCVAKNQDAVRI